jgi:biotin carboxylase
MHGLRRWTTAMADATLSAAVDAGSNSLPQLVIVYGNRSLDAMRLREAARGLCEPIWLVDSDDETAAAVVPLLKRSGPVVEALGRPPAAAADAVRAHTPDGLATFYDTGMEHVAEIAAELGLPFNAPHTARCLEDKYHQRETLRAAGLPTPAVIALPAGTDEATVRALVADADYPAVLKPRRASGSWHTFRVDDAVELLSLLRELAPEPTEERVLEGYLSDGPPMPGGFEADYVSVETLASSGELTHVAITGRLPLVYPLRETGFFVPSTLDAEASREAQMVATSALQALDFRWGCAHTELKLTADGPRLLEINGRIGGGLPEMMKLTSEVDLIRQVMRIALRMGPDVAAMPPTKGVAYRFFYQPPASARRLISIEGIDKVGRLPGIESVVVHHNPGAELDAAHGTRTYLFAVVGHCADHAGVAAMHERIEREIDAVYEHARGTPLEG